jgi:hypothetical protein
MNDLEIITPNKQVKSEDQTWWVRFNEHSGKILGISKKPIIESDKYTILETKNKLCLDVLKHGSRNYVVRWDPVSNGWELGDTHSRLYLTNYDFPFTDVSISEPLGASIQFQVSLSTNELYMYVDKEQVKAEFNLSEISSLVYDENKRYFDLYITTKNNPDRLLSTINVDTEQLFREGYMVYNLSTVTRWTNIKDISIFVKKVFKKYSLEFLEHVVEVDVDSSTPLDVIAGPSKESHITILKKNERQILILFNSEETQKFKLRALKHLKILVSDAKIDNVVGAFSIDTIHLVQYSSYLLDLDFNFPDEPVMIYRNKQISINYKGETDD